MSGAPSGHLRLLSRREWHTYYNNRGGRIGPAHDMTWMASPMGIPIEILTESLEFSALCNEEFSTLFLHSVNAPFSALLLQAEDLFMRENYTSFSDMILQHPKLGDHFLTPGLMSRQPKQLLLAQATVRYIRTTRAARAALAELVK